MELGPKKKAELVDRAILLYVNHVGGTTVSVENIVALVLSDCAARVAPLVEALDKACGDIERVTRTAFVQSVVNDLRNASRDFRASLADEPEPNAPWGFGGHVTRGGMEFQRILHEMEVIEVPMCYAETVRDALNAREREKRS